MTTNAVKRLHRSEVPIQQTWNLQDLFESREVWQTALKENMKAFEMLESYKGRATASASGLYDCLCLLENAYATFVRVSTYVSLRQSEDATNPINQEDSMSIGSMSAAVVSKISFVSSEVIALEREEFDSLFTDEPRLQVFKLYLEDIYKTKAHKLSAETEEALASLGEVFGSPYRVYGVSKATDMNFEDCTDGEGNSLPNSFALFETKYEFSKDETLRNTAYQSFNKTLNQYKNTYAAVYATEVKKQVAMSKLRKYENVTQMLLEPQKVSLEMYENQINIIYNELAPHMQRFAKLKQRQLGLSTMKFSDLKAPLDVTFNPPATYDLIQETIINALAVLGEDYQAAIKTAFEDRWIDYSDNIGKSTGAFCSSPYGVHPYILISYQDNMRSAFTLAHELGHAGHFVLANKHQRIFDTRPSTYFIEAPSTINEMLLAQYLLAQTEDPKMKRWVILQMMGTYYHNFVTHMLEAEFQRRVYRMAEEGTALTAKALCETKLTVIRTFWGEAVQVDEGAGMTWMRQPHYYMGLYPYTYSAGLTASTAIAKRIEAEGKPAAEKWLEVLKAGGTKSPEDLLKMMDIDMSKPEPIREVVAYVGSLIDQLEALY